MKKVRTFRAVIWLGLKERNDDKIHIVKEVERICQTRCDMGGLCVSVTPTKFIYKDGNEDGCAIGLINYPRFPESKKSLLHKAFILANELKIQCGQMRVSIVCNDKTYMI